MSDGFFFTFDNSVVTAPDTAPSHAAHCPDTPDQASQPQPTRRVGAFAWHKLTPDTLRAWQAAAARSSSEAATQWHTLRLTTQSPPDTERVYTLYYQRAPHVPELTCPTPLHPSSHTPHGVTRKSNSHGGTKRQNTNMDHGSDCYEEAGLLTSRCSRNARDIIPGRYYGGFKVWSCAPYLARFVIQHGHRYAPQVWLPSHDTPATAPQVAELGCGQGLGGLAALCLGASRVIFQDYNAEVLERCVRGNIAATRMPACAVGAQTGGGGAGEETTAAEVKLVHGDWSDLALDAECGACDLILGSDVTFDARACDKVAQLLSHWLVKGAAGVALIASKEYYFGTNGGVWEFTQCAIRRGLCVQPVDREEGSGMVHVMLSVTRPDAAEAGSGSRCVALGDT